MSDTIDPVEADRALKTQHRAVWASGDYPTVAAEVIPSLGAVLVEASGVRRVDRFETPEAFLDFFKACFGPTIAAYQGIAGDPERVAALDHDLAHLARRHDLGAARWTGSTSCSPRGGRRARSRPSTHG